MTFQSTNSWVVKGRPAFASTLICLSLLWLAACSKLGSDPGTKGQPTLPEPEARASSAQVPKGKAVAMLAGGCFWGIEELLRQVPGVIDTQVGYTGGQLASPSYEDVSSGSSGHAEAVRVVYDPSVLSYRELLVKWFFRMHDPTTKNRQGNDVGTQYRSAIFVSTPEQRTTAKAVIDELNESGKLPGPIVTSIEDAGSFTPAEAYHQDYLQKNPGGYTCHYLRDWT